MVIAIIIGVAALAVGLIIGFLVRKYMAEAKIRSAEEEARRAGRGLYGVE